MSYLIPLVLSAFKDSTSYNVNMESNKEVISRLKFIGRLQKGEKINARRVYVQPDGILTSIVRTLINQDNRGNTLQFVQDTIQRSFELFTTYERSDKEADRAMCPHIIKDLKIAKTGLMNLKDTYMADVKFCCDMDTFLQTIDSKLAEIEGKYEVDE
jgi:hypothetical protein